jgi:hypothetical protein
MSRSSSFSEILAEVPTPQGRSEVVATAESAYDDHAGRIRVELDAFLRPVDLTHAEQHLRADWLPHAQVVQERVPADEATAATRAMFQTWSHQVRRALEQRPAR